MISRNLNAATSRPAFVVASVVLCCGLISTEPGVASTPARDSVAFTQSPATSPRTLIEGLYVEFNRISNKSINLKEIHATMKQRLNFFMDYREMSSRILGKVRWDKLFKPQRQEFQSLLSSMVRNGHVKRFKPGRKIAISYDDYVRVLKDGRAQVRTTVEIGKTSADVYYSMHFKNGDWAVYDIVVDEVSQVQTYRKSFRKVLKKEGWKGLIKRMRISTLPATPALEKSRSSVMPPAKNRTELDKLSEIIDAAIAGDYVVIVPLREIDPNGVWKPGAFCTGQKYKATIISAVDVDMKASAFTCGTIISVPMKISKVLSGLEKSLSNKSLCTCLDCEKSNVHTKGETKSISAWLSGKETPISAVSKKK